MIGNSIIKKQREISLDFFRGLASISVVFIHTVYWSGQTYGVPEILRTLSLCLDVPFFIFLSGWASSYTSKPYRIFDNLVSIWSRWILFIFTVDIFCMFFWHDSMNLKIFLNQIFFNVGTTLPHLPVIGGSLWFMPMYVSVSILGMFFIFAIRHFDIEIRISIRFIVFLLVGLAYISTGIADSWFMLSRTACFYLALFIIGFYSRGISISLIKYILLIILIVAIWFILSRLYGIPAKNLQNAKFPPHIMYFAASLLSVVTAVFLRDAIKWRKLNNYKIVWGG